MQLPMKRFKIGLGKVNLSELKKPRADIIASGLTSHSSLSFMQEFQVANKKLHWSDKKSDLSENIPMHGLSLTLPADLTKIDVDIKPFWNWLSTAIHCTLWQPHQIESPVQDSNSLNGLSNYRVDGLSFWKKRIVPSNLIPKHLSLSLPASSIRTTENAVPVEEKLKIAQKIRIYPENERLWFDALNLYRRAYNLSIEFMRKERKPSSEFRTQICDWCRLECEQYNTNYNSNLIQSAYRKACDTRTAVIKKRSQGQKADMAFMSRNASTQYFISPRLSPKKQIFPKILKGCYWSENPNDDAIGKAVIVTYRNGQWFASVQKQQMTSQTKLKNLSIIALDPGVRTFQTGFSEQNAISYGEGFVNDKLVPLMLSLDKLLSQRDKLNQQDKSQQWVQDYLKHIKRCIHKIKARQQNLVADLHRRVAFDLVKNYDVILLPTFATQQMVQKSNETRKRFIQRKTVRGMLGLAHYKFKQILKWMAKKYGKTVIDSNESYTSKTLWDGSILNNLGGKASILYQGIRVNRDIHGARNSLIRFLTKVAKHLRLPPKEAYSSDITKTIFCGFGVLK